MWWFCPTWPKCAFGDQKCLIRNKDVPFGNLPHHGTKNCGLLQNIDFFISLPFMGQKVVFWVKKTVVLSVLDRINFPYIANNTAGPSVRDLPVLLIDFDSRDAALSIS